MGWWLLQASWANPDPSPEAALREAVAPLGVEDLRQVGSLTFTFKVERDGALKTSRTWVWRPGDGRVTRRSAGEELTFTFGAPASDAERQADAQFVNDSFWLLPQLHLRWAGQDLTLADGGVVPLPLGEGTGRKISLAYAPQGGGYTPGDAYDLYLDEQGRIVVWSYRKGGAAEPSLTTTFEGYTAVGPLTVATEHRTGDGAFRLYFTDLVVAPPS
jgi:hypothetical protein